MALQAGIMKVTLEYADNIKDDQLIGKQDVFATLRCGSEAFTSETAKDGGTKPVWNQTFTFNVINDNDIEIELFDKKIMHNVSLGRGTLTLAQARVSGRDRQEVPLNTPHNKINGFVAVDVVFEPNGLVGGGMPGYGTQVGCSAPGGYQAAGGYGAPPGAYPPQGGYPPQVYQQGGYPPQGGYPQGGPEVVVVEGGEGHHRMHHHREEYY